MNTLPLLHPELEKPLLTLVVADLADYVSVCLDQEFGEFFRADDITETSFFTDVTQFIQSITGATWFSACAFIASKTQEIQQAVFDKIYRNKPLMG
ncbi:hypothetical protein NTE19_003375 [Vibrio fluvialis]|nr:hypothetical protein [Vibrio fluvialis]